MNDTKGPDMDTARPEPSTTQGTAGGPPPLLQVMDLHKTYNHEGKSIDVLQGVDLTVRQGDMLSIEGASGVGKSTLIQVLGTLDHPTEGKVLFDGEDIFTLSQAELARFRNQTIGFMFQFHHLLPEFSALENVMMPALIKRMPRSAAEKDAREMLASVGLSHRTSHKPGELSGGEQQRVALARSLVLKPRLLLADEPTGNLDPNTGEGIHQVLLQLNRSHQVAVMVVTHSAQLASRMPRRLKICAGKLSPIDSPVTPGLAPGDSRPHPEGCLPTAAALHGQEGAQR